MTTYDWHYRCSFCDQPVEVEDVAVHLDNHRADPTWPGTCSLKRVDGPILKGRPTVGFRRRYGHAHS